MWIEPMPGCSPTIGRLVCMLTYARHRTLTAVEGLTTSALDHHHDAQSNSIGAFLARVVATERVYQILKFENRELSAAELALWEPTLKFGTASRETTRSHPVEHYVEQPAVPGSSETPRADGS